MSKMLPIIVAILSIIVGLLIFFYVNLTKVPEMPKFDTNEWWGIGEKRTEDDSIRNFKVNFSDEIVADLKQRVKNRRPLTPTFEGIQSQYGINIEYLEEVLEYWTEKYDFKKREDILNQFPHYKTKIQGLDIHFMRVKPQESKGKTILPLLMLHGWPSSSKEFVKVIPMLTTPNDRHDFVFEVIAADLPGFGFSQGTNKKGLTPAHMAVIMRNLMHRLGFKKFYIQGGDWGSQVGSHLSTIFQDEVLGFHTNMPISSHELSMYKLIFGAFFPSLVDPVLKERTYPLSKSIEYYVRESGYFHIQATKPDTIGVALTDSPAGLAAYIIEKMAMCTNRDQLDEKHGGIKELDLDDVLDTVTITWVNSCIVTSMRIYAEGFGRPEIGMLHHIPTQVPTAGCNFKYEIMYHSAWMLRDKYPNLLRLTVIDFGGHFAALHTPKAFVDDVYDSVHEFIRYHSDKLRN